MVLPWQLFFTYGYNIKFFIKQEQIIINNLEV
jgi:hypothetical protein